MRTQVCKWVMNIRQVVKVEFMSGFKMVAMIAVHTLTHTLTKAYVLVSNLSDCILAMVHSHLSVGVVPKSSSSRAIQRLRRFSSSHRSTGRKGLERRLAVVSLQRKVERTCGYRGTAYSTH